MEIFDFSGLVRDALEQGASDLHLQTGSKPYFRVDGNVVECRAPEVTGETVEDLKSLVLDDEALRRLEQQGAIDRSYTAGAPGDPICRLRISLSKCLEGYKTVCRLIPREVPTIEGLGLPAIFKHIARQHNGMVIIAGVTGSGKSTTLAAMVQHINAGRNAHVVTIEDPIEFVHTPNKDGTDRSRDSAGAPLNRYFVWT